MADRPAGLLVPITKPFHRATGEVAPVHLRENTRKVIEDGANGIVAAGSTGEAPLLSEDEYRKILEWLRDVVPEGKWLIAGAGRESTRAAVAACRAAGDEGADAVLVRSPSYYAPALKERALIEHFRRVADESPIPVLLYNMPKFTHIALSDSLIAALSDHQNILGAKDSSGDLKNFAAYQEAAPDWSMLIGSGALYYAALEIGAAGAIAATACFATRATRQIGAAFENGDKKGAGAAQEVVAPLHNEVVGRLGIAGVKAAMDVAGVYGGPVRSPLEDLNERALEGLRTLLGDAGIK